MKTLLALMLMGIMFLLASCTTGEEVGFILVAVLILVIAAVVGIILVYIHNKDKIGKVLGVAQDIKNTVSGNPPVKK